MQQLDERIDDLVNEVTNLMNEWEEMMELMEEQLIHYFFLTVIQNMVISLM